MTEVAVKLTDQEWRLKCEELAKLELRKQSTEAMLAEEADEWSDRKKDVNAQIRMLDEQIRKLAWEVDNRQEKRDPQAELPLEGPPPSSPPPSEGQQEESEPPQREPGEEG